MTLYLTSTGLTSPQVASSFLRLLNHREPSQLSFLVISVQESASNAFYLEKSKDQLQGIGALDIEVLALKEDSLVPSREYDVIYVLGGNTFVYLDRIRQSGLDKYIIEAVKTNRSIYVGISAGSIIVGPDISIASWGSEGDSNDIDLKDLKGLGLTDIVVSPHYHNELKDELAEFRRVSGHEVYGLNDEQALVVDDSNINKLYFINI